MKITLIRKDEEQGTEALSLCDTDAFFEKVKTENKAGHISEPVSYTHLRAHET